MFGYVIANIDDLAEAEKVRYREAYCGLCRALGARGGQRCRPTLTYDMTFLALLLSSLYEPAETRKDARCVLHPTKPGTYVASECIDYAADLSIALSYFKFLDDWNDDGKRTARAAAALLAKPYARVKERLPRQCAAIEAGIADLRAIECAREGTIDTAANRFGIVLGELFAWRDDVWEGELLRLGGHLGRFVYLMDAAMDCEDDAKTGNYNPLVIAGCAPEDARELLETVMASAVRSFERLPLEQDLHLLRSVMYAGVWQNYNGRFGVPGAPDVPASREGAAGQSPAPLREGEPQREGAVSR